MSHTFKNCIDTFPTSKQANNQFHTSQKNQQVGKDLGKARCKNKVFDAAMTGLYLLNYRCN